MLKPHQKGSPPPKKSTPIHVPWSKLQVCGSYSPLEPLITLVLSWSAHNPWTVATKMVIQVIWVYCIFWLGFPLLGGEANQKDKHSFWGFPTKKTHQKNILTLPQSLKLTGRGGKTASGARNSALKKNKTNTPYICIYI